MLRNFLIACILCLNVACGQTVSNTHNATDASDIILTSFNKVNAVPNSVTFQNSLQVNNEGGHIQGIQLYTYKDDEFMIITGSSSTESYYAIIKIGEENKVLSVNTILEKPFKHAGGFQIHKNLMAIGIEDNEARNISKVFIYELNNPEVPPEKPKKIIERVGDYERATAGCVGITTYRGQILVMVGDWNTRHLDIYACDLKEENTEAGQFTQLATITTAEMSREDWVTPTWLSYQNINLINSHETLYLVGLGATDKGEDVADLFRIEEINMKDFHLKKIATRKFEKKNDTNFRWGAGIKWDTEKGIGSIFSTTAHIDALTFFNEYRSQDMQKK